MTTAWFPVSRYVPNIHRTMQAQLLSYKRVVVSPEVLKGSLVYLFFLWQTGFLLPLYLLWVDRQIWWMCLYVLKKKAGLENWKIGSFSLLHNKIQVQLLWNSWFLHLFYFKYLARIDVLKAPIHQKSKLQTHRVNFFPDFSFTTVAKQDSENSAMSRPLHMLYFSTQNN